MENPLNLLRTKEGTEILYRVDSTRQCLVCKKSLGLVVFYYSLCKKQSCCVESTYAQSIQCSQLRKKERTGHETQSMGPTCSYCTGFLRIYDTQYGDESIRMLDNNVARLNWQSAVDQPYVAQEPWVWGRSGREVLPKYTLNLSHVSKVPAGYFDANWCYP